MASGPTLQRSAAAIGASSQPHPTHPKKGLRARIRSWTKPPRRITFTRAGKFFMLLSLAVGAGALNTGNNLLFLLLGMMLSAIVASGMLSEAVLRKLEVSRRRPQRLFANRPARGTFTLINPRIYPSVNIEASEQISTQTQGPQPGLNAGKRDVSFYKFWLPDSFEDSSYTAIVRVPDLASQSEHTHTAHYTFASRGLYNSPGVRLATRFPFGIFHKVRDIDMPAEFLVYPEPVEASDWDAEITARFGDISRNKAGHGEEFFGLRDWREGEDRRGIHWKSSARRNAFVVREFEEQEQRAIEIIFLNSTAGLQEIPEVQAKRIFEHHLSKLVGLLESLTAQRYAVALRTLDQASPMGEGHAHLEGLLEHLATIELGVDGATLTLPPSKVATSSSRQRTVARVGVGFGASLAMLREDVDLELALSTSITQEG